jgi:hypothetical protein
MRKNTHSVSAVAVETRLYADNQSRRRSRNALANSPRRRTFARDAGEVANIGSTCGRLVAPQLRALYSSGLGYVGGSAFESNLWLPMLIGAGVSLLAGGAGELVRRKVLAGESDAGENQQSAPDISASAGTARRTFSRP